MSDGSRPVVPDTFEQRCRCFHLEPPDLPDQPECRIVATYQSQRSLAGFVPRRPWHTPMAHNPAAQQHLKRSCVAIAQMMMKRNCPAINKTRPGNGVFHRSIPQCTNSPNFFSSEIPLPEASIANFPARKKAKRYIVASLQARLNLTSARFRHAPVFHNPPQYHASARQPRNYSPRSDQPGSLRQQFPSASTAQNSQAHRALCAAHAL